MKRSDKRRHNKGRPLKLGLPLVATSVKLPTEMLLALRAKSEQMGQGLGDTIRQGLAIALKLDQQSPAEAETTTPTASKSEDP